MRYIQILTLFLAVLSCKQKAIEVPAISDKFYDSCGVMVYYGNDKCLNSDTETLIDDHFIEYPVFNPNNGNELLLYNNEKLFKYNLKTHNKEVIYDKPISAKPSWGTKGWILVNTMNFDIIKISDKDNSIETLTGVDSFYPLFNHTGDTFVYSSRGSRGLIRMTIKGLVVDTIESDIIGGYGMTWNHPKYIAIGSQSIFCFDPEHPKDEIVLNPNSELVTQDMVWVGDDLFYASRYWKNPTPGADPPPHQIYIFKTNVDGTTTQLLESCHIYEYRNPTYSPQRNQLIWQFKHFESVDDCTYINKSEFYYMNLDGRGLEKVDIRL